MNRLASFKILLSVVFLLIFVQIVAAEQIYIPGTAYGGFQYTAQESGIYKFTIESGAVRGPDCVGEIWCGCCPSGQACWSGIVEIYLNRAISWGPILSWCPNVPSSPDYILGTEHFWTSADADAALKGTFVEIPLNEGDILTFTIRDFETSYGDNTGGFTLDVSYTPPVNQPPVASFTYSPSDTTVVNDVLTFTSTSTDPDNTISELQYVWQLPDYSQSTAKSVTYQFSKEGTYTVKLTVSDPSGASSTTTQQIGVVKPTIQITSSPADRKVVVGYPVAYDPRLYLSLKAHGEPIGGTYQWSIVKGNDKIKIVNDPQNSDILIQGIAPSKKLNDVELKVTYTYHSQPYSANIGITVQKPTTLIEWQTPTYDILSNSAIPPFLVSDYETTYYYQIMDQFKPAQPIIGYKLLVTEDVTYLCSNSVTWQNYPNKNYHGTIDAINGRFEDHFKPVENYLGISPLLTTHSEQSIRSEGWSFPLRCINYYYDYAVSEEGKCKKCEKGSVV